MARIRQGVHPILEAEANRLLKEGLSKTTRHADKADILTPWKRWDRRSREVFSPTGVVDASHRSGVFGRAINPARPDLNSRPNGRHTPSLSPNGTGTGEFSLAQFIEDHRQP